MKLSEVIKEIEEKQGIDKYYLQHNHGNSKLELNIEFNNNLSDECCRK